jgi:hypothetical protein
MYRYVKYRYVKYRYVMYRYVKYRYVKYRYSCYILIKFPFSWKIFEKLQVSQATQICPVGTKVFRSDRYVYDKAHSCIPNFANAP